jgi:hypothetical protein
MMPTLLEMDKRKEADRAEDVDPIEAILGAMKSMQRAAAAMEVMGRRQRAPAISPTEITQLLNAGRQERAAMVDAARAIQRDLLATAHQIKNELLEAAREVRAAQAEADRGLLAAILTALEAQQAALIKALRTEAVADDANTREDRMFARAVALVREQGRASVNLFEARLGVGYRRAVRLLDRLEREGIVGPARESLGPRSGREVLLLPGRPEKAEVA